MVVSGGTFRGTPGVLNIDFELFFDIFSGEMATAVCLPP